MERGNPEKAKEVLRRVRGTPDVDTEFQSILVANKVMENMENPWRNIIRSALSNLRHCYSLATLQSLMPRLPGMQAAQWVYQLQHLLAGARISPS